MGEFFMTIVGRQRFANIVGIICVVVSWSVNAADYERFLVR